MCLSRSTGTANDCVEFVCHPQCACKYLFVSRELCACPLLTAAQPIEPQHSYGYIYRNLSRINRIQQAAIMSKPSFLVVGGGFAGVTLAKALYDYADVTLIDRWAPLGFGSLVALPVLAAWY